MSDYGYGVDEDDIQQIPPYGRVERLDVLVRCNRCGSIIEGDVFGQSLHEVWHRTVDERIRRAATALPQVYGSSSVVDPEVTG
jgi:hypothetical protein